MRRLDEGAPLRDAMKGAGLNIPGLSAATKAVDPDGAGLSPSLVGFIVGRGRSAREECSDRAAQLIATALGKPLEHFFDTAAPSSAVAQSTSTTRMQMRGTTIPDLPEQLMTQRELARFLRKSMSWIDKEIQSTKHLADDDPNRFPVHMVGVSRRFNPHEVLAHMAQVRAAKKTARQSA